MSCTSEGCHQGAIQLSAERWAEGRAVLRAADPRMAALVDADPGLDPDAFFDNWPADLWSALVFQVIGQEVSLDAAGDPGPAGGAARRPAADPAELLATDEEALRGIGLSRAKAVYLHDLAARLVVVGPGVQEGAD
jgi:DNA-3-methyladenine glycosylase II